jgi:hypothetical protein
MADEKQHALDAVTNRFAGVDRFDLSKAFVVETKPFLLGSLNRVDFKRKDGSDKTVYAWVPELDGKTGKLRGNVEIFENTDQLIPFVSRTPSVQGNKALGDFISKLGLVDVVSGLIAIIMTFTMVFIVVYQIIHGINVDIPGLLANAITTILGFYFGRATVAQASTSP